MKRLSISLFLLTAVLCATGCGAKDPLEKKYGPDSSYFRGLEYLNKKENARAKVSFRTAAKDASPLVKRRSLEQLASMGSVQENIIVLKELYALYPDEDSLLLYTRELYKAEDYSQIIEVTKDLSPLDGNNESIFYRLSSLYKKGFADFNSEYSIWNSKRNFSSEHVKLYTALQTSRDIKDMELASFRAKVFSYEYQAAINMIPSICENSENLLPQIINDMGKSYLYGSTANLSNAQKLLSLVEKAPKESLYNIYFYVARLYDKEANYYEKTAKYYLLAMEKAEDPLSYDNALWYYLNACLKLSIKDAIDALTTYGPTWHDASYFDDFFDTLSLRMLSRHVWFAYYQLTNSIETFASKETISKFSYITARLLQTGILKINGIKHDEAAEKLLLKAFSDSSDLYYRFVSCMALGKSKDELKEKLTYISEDKNFTLNSEEDSLLLGYADYNLLSDIYGEWKKAGQNISLQTSQIIAKKLREEGEKVPAFYTQALRIASKKLYKSEAPLAKELWEEAFPKDYKDYVEEYAKTFSLSEYVLYALIRSESFFDASVKSHAGATGLTQLMDGTAGDVARKLKIETYDLKDAKTNIMFGSYYLQELKGRLDDSLILSAFAYNGGIGHVRSWLKSADLNFGMEDLPLDLFLESLPFSETREYGRKIVTAACVYAALYYNKTVDEVCDEIFNWRK